VERPPDDRLSRKRTLDQLAAEAGLLFAELTAKKEPSPPTGAAITLGTT
jgi:hypothetical protein